MHNAEPLVRLHLWEELGLAEISIHRPQAHNAMTMDMYAALSEHLKECEALDCVKSIALKGSGGKSFISGTDIHHFQDFTTGSQGLEYEKHIESLINQIERVRKPTMALIDGWTAGGGLAIATACDFRLATLKSQFGAPIAKTLSNTLSSKNIARLMAYFGASPTKRMLLAAEFLPASEALACGFLYSTHEEESGLLAARDALALKLGKLSPLTQEVCKESMRRIISEFNYFDDDLIERSYGSKIFQDNVKNFIHK